MHDAPARLYEYPDLSGAETEGRQMVSWRHSLQLK